MEYHVYWLLKSSCFELCEDGNTVFFELKSWWKDDIYWLLKSSCFEHFRGGKNGLFLSQKVNGKMIFTDYLKVLVLTFSEIGNTVFFWAKKLMERWYLLDLFQLSMIFQDMENLVFCAVQTITLRSTSKTESIILIQKRLTQASIFCKSKTIPTATFWVILACRRRRCLLTCNKCMR